MNPYTNMFKLFDKYKVNDQKSLDAFLQKLPTSTDYPIKNNDQFTSLFDAFCNGLLLNSSVEEQAFAEGGIHQFSLNLTPRIHEDNVRKALFLSRVATIFSAHTMTQYTTSYSNYYDGSSDIWYSWNLHHDFIRDIYAYRKLLEKNLIRIVPKEVQEIQNNEIVDGAGGHSSSNNHIIPLLEDIESTRVLQLSPNQKLLDKIVAKS